MADAPDKQSSEASGDNSTNAETGGGAIRDPSTVGSFSPRARRHILFGWWSLLFFIVLGVTLEGMHYFQVEWFLGEASAARRLMWRLSHAHGTLLAVLHVAFGVTMMMVPPASAGRGLVSPLLIGASILLPGGFFLGGIQIYGGDPGLGVFLVPVGALMLFAAVVGTALTVTKTSS